MIGYFMGFSLFGQTFFAALCHQQEWSSEAKISRKHPVCMVFESSFVTSFCESFIYRIDNIQQIADALQKVCN